MVQNIQVVRARYNAAWDSYPFLAMNVTRIAKIILHCFAFFRSVIGYTKNQVSE